MYLPWPPWDMQTQIGSFLFYVASPLVAKVSTLSVAVAGIIALNFANENMA